MPYDRINQISTSIDGMVFGQTNASNEQCVFKVHDRLRNHNKKAYEPQVLSIGPYHHGKCNLKEMETYKLKYLKEYLVRRGEYSANRYISALMKHEDQARRCYAEEINLEGDNFVKMLCLDSIFVIEFLRKLSSDELPEDDKIFQTDWLETAISADLILFENQIPFFILVELFDMTKLPGQEDNLIKLALPLRLAPFDINPSQDYLNELVFSLCPLPSANRDRGKHPSIPANEVIHLLGLVHKICCSSFAVNDPVDYYPLKIIKSASELGQSGIKFGSAEKNALWHHITFENGKITIPHLAVEDHTESMFRNLIAFEQYMISSTSWKPVTDYVRFLDNLIESSRDVEKLRHCNIITNGLGDDQFVATMFNKLSRDLTVNDRKFCYSRVYKKVNEYSDKRCNIWKAYVMRNYFNTPCSTISFLAAVVLLILTAVSTIFSILAVISGK